VNIKLNCDMGESFGIWKMGLDEKIMPYIDMANLACGFHASDAVTMNDSVFLAKKNDVTIGAHPGYQDLVGFGRRSISYSSDEIKAIVIYQMGALSAFCKIHNTQISYVKPHGAMYNDMMKDENILRAILEAISAFDKNIKLMLLSTPNNELCKNIANEYNIELIYEVFADRNYNDDGTLVSRSNENAVIHDINRVKERISTLQENGYLTSANNQKLFIQADSVCVHGDNEKALEFIKLLKTLLN
jgi:UPF0271 protein